MYTYCVSDLCACGCMHVQLSVCLKCQLISLSFLVKQEHQKLLESIHVEYKMKHTLFIDEKKERERWWVKDLVEKLQSSDYEIM